ncbi:hypothetical protein HS1genome_0995 [Sulfodiicoccus acidiphilus]|uniref:Uncharacterized protein n=1 Tax=Sulfodiicoccus acidiphilus TaxID=1670455 RepID=A0A348B354_9CREN|nr:hypothetical protein [Sulfodiicoccus acidiphilus]BBD72606.1 hypothetical protein HS1genome_0995 [Sulfodiicoccus acidiphilus]GGT93375.1 hypothetical protein GCM10007116_08810 [Sulfodiicoccus acidiphilus]
MKLGLFRKTGDEEPNLTVRDELGEWLLVRRNPFLSQICGAVNSVTSKIGLKRYGTYVLYYKGETELRNLISAKLMLVTNAKVDEYKFLEKLHTHFKRYGDLFNSNLSSLKMSSFFYTFVSGDFVIKNAKRSNVSVKLLLPPLGVRGEEIPYDMNSLFTSIIRRTLNSPSCVLQNISFSPPQLGIAASCSRVEDVPDSFKIALAYFESDSELKMEFKRVSARQVEINLLMNDFNLASVIPLVWDKLLIA